MNHTDYDYVDEIMFFELQGQIKGYPVWADPNNVEPFLNENVPPPAACPSIVNAKALGKNSFSLVCKL